MLNDYGKSLFKPLCSVQNIILALAAVFVAGLAIRVYSLNSSEIASWVQSLGSILAIWGAFRVGSLAHEREVERRKSESNELKLQTNNLLVRLSQSTWFELINLHEALKGSFKDFGNPSLVTYTALGGDCTWPHILEALRSVNVKDITGVQNLLLMDMKVACTYAIRVCERLDNWNSLGDEERHVVSRVGYHLARVEQAHKVLSGAVIEKAKESSENWNQSPQKQSMSSDR